jgi:LmbE family N-acetylglucosaminyl deacetylase
MQRLTPWADGRPLELLLIGAHPDDLEIGCGGTVLRWVREGRIARATWLVLSGDEGRAAEARRSADRFLSGVPESRVLIEAFRDGYFPYQGEAIKDGFERVKTAVEPDIVLTHARYDRHQDHRFVSELTWQTFRDHLVLEFEVPKFDGELSQPDVYVELHDEDAAAKARLLIEGFPSQRDRPWFTPETFAGLARIRGVECRSATGLAEGFIARKIVLG